MGRKRTSSAAPTRAQDPSSSAAAAVFDISELFEMILIKNTIDFRQLFVLQRTCRTWRDKINNSLPLQQKMFLRPITNSSATRYDIHPLASELLRRLVNNGRQGRADSRYLKHAPDILLFKPSRKEVRVCFMLSCYPHSDIITVHNKQGIRLSDVRKVVKERFEEEVSGVPEEIGGEKSILKAFIAG
jgi:hypothetical protein